MKTYLGIMLGGAIGSALRFAMATWVANAFGETFPWGTLLVNVIGSFGIGLYSGLTSPEGIWLVSPDMRIFVMVGIFGGFTTFSSFSLQTLSLAQAGQWMAAGGNILLSVVLCLLFVYVGHVCAALLTSQTLK